ncbi:MAG TPA: sigma-70 family RNA polymerase sigma factor [Blastocatellia bacterium]|nr:sigma-70 family RNA polymerase sigma factor [Blastocatellia bacterium]
MAIDEKPSRTTSDQGATGGLNAQPTQFDSMSDEQLVDLFLECQKRSDRGQAHFCFERIIGRYQWLINHVVRNSRFKFPAWDSTDDLLSRIAFKIYRGLAQWRKQGKLSSFIARIATTEMIDTIRRVGRDKTWDPSSQTGEDDRDQASPLDRAQSPGLSPEAEAAAREQSRLVGKLLGEVCKDWKDSVIVNEYIINSMGAKEIADKYGMSEDLVYQRARRLRVRLLKWLTDHGITSAEQLLGAPPSAAHA